MTSPSRTMFDMEGFTPDRPTRPRQPDTEEQQKRLDELSVLSNEERLEELKKLKDFFDDRGEEKYNEPYIPKVRRVTKPTPRSPSYGPDETFVIPGLPDEDVSMTPEELKHYMSDNTNNLVKFNLRMEARRQKRWDDLKAQLQLIASSSEGEQSEMSELDLNKKDDVDDACDVCTVSLVPPLRF